MPIRVVRTLLLVLLVGLPASTAAQGRVTTPRDQFGHPIGADYVLPNYQQLVAYWKKLDAESPRMSLVDIGRTAEGRTQYMAIVTSPENHRSLARYREIARRLALARDLPELEAQQLARDGKAVVWIDGGLHATEVLGAQQLMETVYQLVSRNDAETQRILRDVIVLAVHANPDGMDLVSDWYMREKEPTRRSTAGIPRLYQKYIGHDNNRDFFASTQPESENMNRVLYHRWFPQIMYNHHQTGPTGTVMFAPPFRDPFNYNFDPLIVTSLDLVGAAMHNRFVAEDKPGVTMRRGANYSTWWNGGLRTTVYFHNMIGLLTETIGNPTPIQIPFVANRQIPSGDLPFPIRPQQWHFRNSVDYSVTANYAVLDLASRYREQFLFNIFRMGRNSIERGSRDHWTVTPSELDSVRSALQGSGATDVDGVMNPGGQSREALSPEQSRRATAMLRDPAKRDPRGYIIPADQPDFPTATKFVNALLETGVEVHRATSPFQVGGKSYPTGSYVVKTAQAFRPHVLDMFEPQDHPNDFRYPGGPPIPPYDNAGWTLAFQMGIRFDRVLEGFSGPFEQIRSWNIAPAPGRVVGTGAGYLLSARANDSFRALNRLLASGANVYRLTAATQAGGIDFQPGAFYVVGSDSTRLQLNQLATQLGLTFVATGQLPGGQHLQLAPVRVGLWDRYGGSMPSGWTRWILEQFEQPFKLVYSRHLDAGNLRNQFDVLVFVNEAIPDRDVAPGFDNALSEDRVPAELRNTLGRISVEATVPRLREFLQTGGTVITIGSSNALARHLDLPVGDKLVETVEGRERRLPGEKFYIPGSVLQVRVDNTHPLGWGMDERVDVLFDRSPVFTRAPGSGAAGIRRVAWYDSAAPLRSGWAWGQERLQGGDAVLEVPVGRGRLIMMGPEVLFRAQPHGTFKFFFNGLANATATPVAPK